VANANCKWAFKARSRARAFGWKSQPAIARVREAVAEIKKVAKRDPVLAAAGATTADLQASIGSGKGYVMSGRALVVKPAEPAGQRAYLDRPLARNDVLTIALGEHQPNIETLLLQRLGQGVYLARSNRRVGKRQSYLDELGQRPSAAASEIHIQ
jgi:hypothetical protein